MTKPQLQKSKLAAEIDSAIGDRVTLAQRALADIQKAVAAYDHAPVRNALRAMAAIYDLK